MNIKMKSLLREDVFGHYVEDLDTRKIAETINAPHVSAKISTLGGKGRESLIFTISLDDKSLWPNGIFENSRYLIFIVNNDTNSLELVNKHYKITEKFRKTKVKSIIESINKINAYINSIK
jgi:hypothetical protein